jgi:Flp pilus assembly pilin Flp
MIALRLWVRERGEAGQTSFEYLGIAVVIVIIIVAIATSGIGTKIAKAITDQVDNITGAG